MSEAAITRAPARSPADPRPELVERDGRYVVTGSRCARCGYPMTVSPPRCAACFGGPMAPAEFGPRGIVFTATVLRIGVPGREPPYGLAYVDLDDGPRVLAHFDAGSPLPPGASVELCGWTEHGDLFVRAVKQ